MNEKDLFKGIDLLKEECERTVLCGNNEEVAWSITSILLYADEKVVVEALKKYKILKQTKDIFNREND